MNVQQQLRGMERKLDHIHELLHRLFRREMFVMVSQAELLAKAQQILTKATANTDALTSIAGVIDDQKALIADLKSQLDAAIASGDPVATQAASDALDQGIAALDAQAAAEAALAGTPAATPPAA